MQNIYGVIINDKVSDEIKAIQLLQTTGAGLLEQEYNALNEEDKKELEKQNVCYQTLYNEDIIGMGCDKYFENDSWYIEYKKEVADNE